MKKINLTLVVMAAWASHTTFAQQQTWQTTQQVIAPHDNANIGTQNKRGINIITDNIKRAGVDSLGNFSITKLAGNGYRLLYVDNNGNLVDAPATGGGGNPPANIPSTPCEPNMIPWFEGGNNVNPLGLNTIGTCNAIDFILKSNSKQLLFLKASNNYFGFGHNNSNPLHPYDFKFGNDNIAFKLDNNGVFGQIETTEAMSLNFGTNNNPTTFDIFENGIARFGISGGYIYMNNDVGITNNLTIGNTLSVNNLAFIAGGLKVGSALSSSTFKSSVGSGSGDCFQTQTSNANAKAISVLNTANTPAAETFVVLGNGKTHIGAGRPASAGVAAAAMLSVDGLILAREVRVAIAQTTHWADYVFDKNYKLMPLKDVEDFVAKNHHLPEVPSEAEVVKDGMDVTEINVLLLKKVEELTLYMIELNKKVEGLEKVNKELEK